jgi:predicted nucleic acid-binding protein
MEERRVYLDSSAIVKRYVQEKGTDVVDSVFREAEMGACVVCFSMWNVGELATVLDKVERKGMLNAREVFGTFLRETMRLRRSGSVDVIPVSSHLIERSTLYVFRHHVYVGDAIQLAASIEASCDQFITSDKRLGDVAKTEGLQTVVL